MEFSYMLAQFDPLGEVDFFPLLFLFARLIRGDLCLLRSDSESAGSDKSRYWKISVTFSSFCILFRHHLLFRRWYLQHCVQLAPSTCHCWWVYELLSIPLLGLSLLSSSYPLTNRISSFSPTCSSVTITNAVDAAFSIGLVWITAVDNCRTEMIRFSLNVTTSLIATTIVILSSLRRRTISLSSSVTDGRYSGDPVPLLSDTSWLPWLGKLRFANRKFGLFLATRCSAQQS